MKKKQFELKLTYECVINEVYERILKKYMETKNEKYNLVNKNTKIKCEGIIN